MAEFGWRDRGKLPHVNLPGLTQFITFRFADSLPREVVFRYRRAGEELQGLDVSLDKAHGACLLRDPSSASEVVRCLLATDGTMCDLLAWTVMPNHVHVVASVREWVDLGDLVRAWKGPAAIAINRLHGRSGRLWAREYHDRYMRDDGHLTRTVAYIERNPVKAGLCQSPEEWEFGSAWSGIAD